MNKKDYTPIDTSNDAMMVQNNLRSVKADNYHFLGFKTKEEKNLLKKAKNAFKSSLKELQDSFLDQILSTKSIKFNLSKISKS